MTVQEAIEAMKFYKQKLYNGIFNQFIKAFDVAIQALEEVEQYRALGTVEQLEWCKDASHWKSLYKEKLEQYESLGTVEELKEAREKQVAKKPIKNNPIINNFWSEDSMLCPICHNYVGTLFRDTYCSCCGQILSKEGGTSD